MFNTVVQMLFLRTDLHLHRNHIFAVLSYAMYFLRSLFGDTTDI